MPAEPKLTVPGLADSVKLGVAGGVVSSVKLRVDDQPEVLPAASVAIARQ